MAILRHTLKATAVAAGLSLLAGTALALLINRGDWMPALFNSSLAIGMAALAILVIVVTIRMNIGGKLAAVGREDGQTKQASE